MSDKALSGLRLSHGKDLHMLDDEPPADRPIRKAGTDILPISASMPCALSNVLSLNIPGSSFFFAHGRAFCVSLDWRLVAFKDAERISADVMPVACAHPFPPRTAFNFLPSGASEAFCRAIQCAKMRHSRDLLSVHICDPLVHEPKRSERPCKSFQISVHGEPRVR